MVRNCLRKRLHVILFACFITATSLFAADDTPSSETIETLDQLSLNDLLTMKITTGSFLDLDIE